jgi:predicted nuclease of restriction endonuclease-like (RecB) superfamily
MAKPRKSRLSRSSGLTFESLVVSIRDIDRDLASQAKRAVNISVTLRNWLIGWHIEEYERKGADRAKYGERLMHQLSEELVAHGVSRADRRELYRYRTFYRTYPEIVESLSPQFQRMMAGARESSRAISLKGLPAIVETPSPQLKKNTAGSRKSPRSKEQSAPPAIVETPSPQLKKITAGSRKSPRSKEQSAPPAIVETPSPQFGISAGELIRKLSFSHIAELLAIDDPKKRGFYEIECVQGNWAVRELKRQVASLYFERSVLSRDKARLTKLANDGAEGEEPRLSIRDPYIFEFIGLKAREVMGESHLEDQLLDKLQDFLLELGHGFCFEARQKRILIGDTHGFVDLVFYHRVLKCHVLIELKLEAFSHQNIGQLNTYVSWYARNMMADGDNPPVGILLCTQKDHALVEYAIAGMDNKLFVSKYQLHLPDREQLRRELERTLKAES